MDIKETLQTISVPNHQRRNIILDVLHQNDIHYQLETLNPKEYTNIVLHNDMYINPNMKILLSAHYDAVPKSHGANDNGAAVAMLLKIAEYAQSHLSYCPIDIVLFDREETGFVGSYEYLRMHLREHAKQPIFFINCDVIGCGDGMVIVKHDNNRYYPTASKVLTKDFINKYNITEYRQFPPSDAINLSRAGRLNGIEISVFPQSDINNQASSAVFQYMHNRKYDDIAFINYDMINHVYESLIELLFVPEVS